VAVGLYQAGAILFFIVLVAGVVMIYNTFNISVMDRMRSFGLLRVRRGVESANQEAGEKGRVFAAALGHSRRRASGDGRHALLLRAP
jgi:hypothetical protein